MQMRRLENAILIALLSKYLICFMRQSLPRTECTVSHAPFHVNEMGEKSVFGWRFFDRHQYKQSFFNAISFNSSIFYQIRCLSFTKKCRWFNDLVDFGHKLDLLTVKTICQVKISSSHREKLKGLMIAYRAIATAEHCSPVRFLPISALFFLFIHLHAHILLLRLLTPAWNMLALHVWIYYWHEENLCSILLFVRSRETIITVLTEIPSPQ